MGLAVFEILNLTNSFLAAIQFDLIHVHVKSKVQRLNFGGLRSDFLEVVVFLKFAIRQWEF